MIVLISDLERMGITAHGWFFTGHLQENDPTFYYKHPRDTRTAGEWLDWMYGCQADYESWHYDLMRECYE